MWFCFRLHTYMTIINPTLSQTELVQRVRPKYMYSIPIRLFFSGHREVHNINMPGQIIWDMNTKVSKTENSKPGRSALLCLWHIDFHKFYSFPVDHSTALLLIFSIDLYSFPGTKSTDRVYYRIQVNKKPNTSNINMILPHFFRY